MPWFNYWWTNPLIKISTVKLAEKAGISRSSFYTHYKDKYDMIEHYQSKLFHTFEYIFQKHAHHKRDAILEVFEYLESEPLLAALLSENGTKEFKISWEISFTLCLAPTFRNALWNYNSLQ